MNATPITQISEHVAVLRKTFNADKTRPLATRKKILLQLKSLLTEGEEQLTSALHKDLHKNPVETFLMEINVILTEIQDHLDYLEDWAAPEKVATNLINIPGHSTIRSDPLGVCCIISTWNYPIHVTLMPLVGCISAGNCALIRLPPDGTADND